MSFKSCNTNGCRFAMNHSGTCLADSGEVLTRAEPIVISIAQAPTILGVHETVWLESMDGYKWTVVCSVRDAMRAMANVMMGVMLVAMERQNDLQWYEWIQQEDGAVRSLGLTPDAIGSPSDAERVSREWSAEVRRKVAALKPSGPRIACQNEED